MVSRALKFGVYDAAVLFNVRNAGRSEEVGGKNLIPKEPGKEQVDKA